MQPDDRNRITAQARDIINNVVGEAYVPMNQKRPTPLTNSELGKLARRLIPELAAAILSLAEEGDKDA
jgi:hypothetical protein